MERGYVDALPSNMSSHVFLAIMSEQPAKETWGCFALANGERKIHVLFCGCGSRWLGNAISANSGSYFARMRMTTSPNWVPGLQPSRSLQRVKTDIDVVPGSGRKGYLVLNFVFCVYARICHDESHLTHGEAMTRVLRDGAHCMWPPAMGKRILWTAK